MGLHLAGRFLRGRPLFEFSLPLCGVQTETTMKALIAMIVGASFLLGLAGCNTVEGAGKDVKAGGQKVENEAAEHKKY